MSKKRNHKKKKKVNNEISEESNKALNIIGWIFVGFFIWFILLNTAHEFVMNDKTKKLFFYIVFLVIIVDIIFVKRFIKTDIYFLRRYEKWNVLAYFTPFPLFVIGMSLMLSLSVTHIILPYMLHTVFGNVQETTFNVAKKREYILCPDGDGSWNESSHMDSDCKLVKDICIKNEQFKKFKFCIGILSEEDWGKVQKEDDIVVKGKISFLGVKPVSYVLLDDQSN